MEDRDDNILYGNISNIDNLEVQRSLPLLALGKSDITLSEFKILDIYLARINSHNENQRSVRFKKGELEAIMGKKLNISEVRPQMYNLMGKVVEINDPSKPREARFITLFEEAYVSQDENGLWQFDLTCTNKAKEYFFNVEQIGYLRYKLKSVSSIRSRFSYLMFLYIESNRFRKTWKVDLDVLRDYFKCTEKTYQEYKFFNQKVLKKSQEELEEKTKCKFTYEPIRTGRNVTAIKFTVKTLKELSLESIENNNGGMESVYDMIDMEDDNYPINFYRLVLPVELTDEQIKVLEMEARENVIKDYDGFVPLECAIYSYLEKKVALMEAQNGKITSKFAWLKKACRENW